jgi:hypothetical protein
MDIIFLREVRVDTVIGVYEWERRAPQTIELDLDIGIPSLVTATFTHGAPNSSRTKRAIRSASASINKKCSAANKARTRSTTTP